MRMRAGIRTPEIEQEIITRLSKGEPMAQICRDEHMPSDRAVRYWQEDDPEFASAIARAREYGFDAIAADCLSIIDAPPERVIASQGDGKTETRIDSASVQWAKNRAEIRLKLLAKWDPKRYGEKTLVGSDPENPLPQGIAVTFHKGDDAG